MNRTLGLALAFGLMFVGTASAQERPVPPGSVVQPTGQTRTEQRQSQQWVSMQEAIAAGRIEPREAARLTRLMNGIQQYQERAYADGVLTLREQAHLERYQTRLDRELVQASR